MMSILRNRSEEMARTVAFGLLIASSIFSGGIYYHDVHMPYVSHNLIRFSHGGEVVQVRGAGHVHVALNHVTQLGAP